MVQAYFIQKSIILSLRQVSGFNRSQSLRDNDIAFGPFVG